MYFSLVLFYQISSEISSTVIKKHAHLFLLYIWFCSWQERSKTAEGTNSCDDIILQLSEEYLSAQRLCSHMLVLIFAKIKKKHVNFLLLERLWNESLVSKRKRYLADIKHSNQTRKTLRKNTSGGWTFQWCPLFS